MAIPIAADYSMQFLLPPSLEDFVSGDHPARFLRELVDGLDLGLMGFRAQPVMEGRPPYANSLLLKVWLYGYLNRIGSTRRLEQACREHLSLVWLTGMNYPDHNTLWRFWTQNKKAIRDLHRQSVHLAMKADLVSLALLAVDGTKIEAVASGYSGWSKEYMEKVLGQLDRVMDQVEQEVEQNQEKEQGEYRLPASVTEREQLRARMAAGLRELAQSQRQHYHAIEPEAHRMKCSGRNRFGYNAQAVSDEKGGIILAQDVTDQENDVGQLGLMLQAAKDNVAPDSAFGDQSQAPSMLEAVADSGYGAGQDIARAQEEGFVVNVPVLEGKPKRDNLYHSSNFQYDRQKDVTVCPQKRELGFEREKDRRGQTVRVYRCHHEDCPVRSLCTQDKQGRMIEIGPYHEVVVAMREKLKEPETQKKMRRRGTLIEPVFARIKQALGFRRWTVRGLEGVRTQWSLLCLTVNLQALMKVWLKGELKLS